MRAGTPRSERSDRSTDCPPRGLDRLTMREREVLLLLADGLTNQVLARRLGIAERTVRAHVLGIVRKLELQTRTEAALMGDRHRAQLISHPAMPDVAMPDVAMP
ncbi:helix-turn-helix transcriptional regulator [Streptomyces collinus]|uniref:helix-turn-helix domain-containing protein n=1 Tax=Streptomyces collinus TaxID=42684 RepID=UPI003821B919